MDGCHRVSTRDADPALALRDWSRALDLILPGLRFDPLESHFEATLQRRRLAGFDLSLVHAAPQRIRTAARPLDHGQTRYAFIHLRTGRLRVRQFGRFVELGAGDCIVLDASAQSEVLTCAESESLNFVVPSALMRQWLPRPECAVARRFAGDDRCARVLLDLLALLGDDDAAMPDSTSLLLPLLGGALTLAVGAQQPEGTEHAGRLLNRIRQAMASRYFDHAYCPQTAAAEAGISRRYLTALFAQAGTTFNTELIALRLDRGAEMLRDPRFDRLSVMDVSLRCGFSDVSHFSKRFRARFATSPASYRAQIGADEIPVLH